MAQIRRDDGVQFVVQPYRELLNIQQISTLKREIRKLAKKHGENICIFKRDNGHFEVVFSRELGFLLGETIWEYFKKPRNLIYCSALSEKNSILLVIVKEGSVYLDTKVSSSELIEELAGLSTSNEQYDVYVYGNVPISDTAYAMENAADNKADTFVLDKKIINSFKVLSEPVLSFLLLNDYLQLLPLELALNAPCFRNKFVRPIAILIAAVLVGFIGYWIFSPDSDNTNQIGGKAVEQPKDPYEFYNKDLTTPAPEKQMIEMNKIIGNFIALPGWDLIKLEYNNGIYTAQIKQMPEGNIEMLRIWGKKYGVNAQGAGAITINSILSNRPIPKNIYNLDKVVKIITNKLTFVITKNDLKFGTINNYQKTRSVGLEIGFKNFSPLVFDLLGKLLAGFPLHITSVTLTVAENLFSGSIKLIIWGN